MELDQIFPFMYYQYMKGNPSMAIQLFPFVAAQNQVDEMFQ